MISSCIAHAVVPTAVGSDTRGLCKARSAWGRVFANDSQRAMNRQTDNRRGNQARAPNFGQTCFNRSSGLDQPDAARNARSLAPRVGEKNTQRVVTLFGLLHGAQRVVDDQRRIFANHHGYRALNGFSLAHKQAICVIARMRIRVRWCLPMGRSMGRSAPYALGGDAPCNGDAAWNQPSHQPPLLSRSQRAADTSPATCAGGCRGSSLVVRYHACDSSLKQWARRTTAGILYRHNLAHQ